MFDKVYIIIYNQRNKYIFLKNLQERTEILMLADCHLHCYFSGDSEANPKDIIKTAIEKGIPYICFTDHLDLDYPDSECDFNLDIENYYTELLTLKDNYTKQITICIGMETGLQPHLSEQLDAKISLKDFDFIIGSSHIINGVDPYYPVFFENRTNKEAYTEYFESILDCIDSCSNFDVYGHLDYVVRYTPYKNQPFKYKDFSDHIDLILKKLITNGKGIEVNTGGYNAGLSCPNPCPDIIKRYKELGGEILTIGSDAHTADRVGSYFNEVNHLLLDCGFKYYSVFEKRKPLFKKIGN